MGFWQQLFGGKHEPVAAPRPLPAEELVQRVQAGTKVSLDRALAGASDEEEEACLWAVLPHADGAFRVEVVERLAEFELDSAQQTRLLLAALQRVPGAAWTAAAVADCCDLPALTSQAVAATPCHGEVLDAVAQVVAARCESALGLGPREESFDLAACADLVSAWQEALCGVDGAGPGDLVAIDLAIRACTSAERHGDELAAGWGPELAARLRELLARLLARPPRGAASWPERILAGVRHDHLDVALQALAAAAIARVPVGAAVLERVRAAPDDPRAWSLAEQLNMDPTVLATLAPLAEQALAGRQLRQDELCSPASQASCKSCGTGSKAADDDGLMVPRALEARILPLLSACAASPGAHAELVRQCLQAPSPALRARAAAVLQRWPADAIPDDIWRVVEGLAGDSLPQVQSQVAALLARGRTDDADDLEAAEDAVEDDGQDEARA